MKMVETIARAIDAAEVAWCAEHQDKSVADMPDELKALAALKAMREPTDAMHEAANREWDGRMSARSAGVWQAMIDAAIAEAKTP